MINFYLNKPTNFFQSDVSSLRSHESLTITKKRKRIQKDVNESRVKVYPKNEKNRPVELCPGRGAYSSPAFLKIAFARKPDIFSNIADELIMSQILILNL
jgi:hypothetical protein